MTSPAQKAGQAFHDFVFEISVKFFSVQYADSQYDLLHFITDRYKSLMMSFWFDNNI